MADELSADKTPGFKVGEKKTIDEYQQLGKSMLKDEERENIWFKPLREVAKIIYQTVYIYSLSSALVLCYFCSTFGLISIQIKSLQTTSDWTTRSER